MFSESIDYRAELNEEQYAAVTAPPGPALVLAGAGSGKTRTLTYRVAYLLQEKCIHPDSLLLLTFTNKAAREMGDRVKELIPGSNKPRWSGTFHSIGGRLLRQFGHHVGLKPNFTILDESDSESLLSNVIKDYDKAFLKEKANPKAKVIRNLISYGRNTNANMPELLEQRYPFEKHLHPKIMAFAKLYQQAKLDQQVADYDDLLTHWLDLLKNFPQVREQLEARFPWIMVDEYQDTNIIQSEIIDLIGGHHNIMAVGDDAQCIYTWRGAVFENIHGFPDRHPDTRMYKILTNYRSTPQILHLANAVLAAQPIGSGYEKELTPQRSAMEKPYVVPVMDTRQQAEFLVNRIKGLHDEGHLLRDIAVLYRAHYQAVDLQMELARRGIPFVITSGVKFFEQAHIRDFVAQLRVIANPSDRAAFNRLLSMLPKVGPATITKILKAADKVWTQRQQEFSKNTPDLFKPGQSARQEPTLIEAMAEGEVVSKVPAETRGDYQSLMATLLELENAFKSEDGKAIRPTTIVELALDGWYPDYMKNIYPDWDQRQDDLDSLVGFAANFETLTECLAQLVLLNSETGNRSIDPEGDHVRLSTIHQAKGLEFPVVFVICCADELFPLKRAIESGDLEEERRLFYVAVTRARDELYLSYPLLFHTRGGSMRMEPSRFLREIPPDRYEKLNYRYNW
jgi:DNA helicase-2/ATP-dependent DNA helicase PcrA